MSSGIVIELECSDVVVYSLLRVGISPIRTLRVKNASDLPLRGLTLTISVTQWSGVFTKGLGDIGPGKALAVTGLDFGQRLLQKRDLDALNEQRNDAPATLVVTVEADEVPDLDEIPPPDPPKPRRVSVTVKQPITVMEPATCSWESGHERSLAAFVQPRDRCVYMLSRGAQNSLGGPEESRSIRAHCQKTGADGARTALRLIYEELWRRDLEQFTDPPSYRRFLQLVRTPSEILETGRATCIDLVHLTASFLENNFFDDPDGPRGVAFQPLIIVSRSRGHAVVGAWAPGRHDVLVDRVVIDAADLKSLVKRGEIVVVDATGAARDSSGGRLDFDSALVKARDVVASSQDVFAVNVVAARVPHDGLPAVEPLMRTEGWLGESAYLALRFSRDVLTETGTDKLERAHLLIGLIDLGKAGSAARLFQRRAHKVRAHLVARLERKETTHSAVERVAHASPKYTEIVNRLGARELRAFGGEHVEEFHLLVALMRQCAAGRGSSVAKALEEVGLTPGQCLERLIAMNVSRDESHRLSDIEQCSDSEDPSKQSGRKTKPRRS